MHINNEPNNSRTTHESLSVAGRTLGTPTSTDQPRQTDPPTEQAKAWGGRWRRTRENRKAWGYPGRAGHIVIFASRTPHQRQANEPQPVQAQVEASRRQETRQQQTKAQLDIISSIIATTRRYCLFQGTFLRRFDPKYSQVAHTTVWWWIVEEVKWLSPTDQAGPTVETPNGQLPTSTDGPNSPRRINQLLATRNLPSPRQEKQ